MPEHTVRYRYDRARRVRVFNSYSCKGSVWYPALPVLNDATAIAELYR